MPLADRPSLSADRLAQHFFINDWVENDRGVEEEYTWKPHQVRFVLWYHLTTYIPNDAIATAFNVTLDAGGDDVPEMKAANVQNIIDVIKNRMKLIDTEIGERGLGKWPRPSELGWIPCDHGMSCATLAEVSHGAMTSVMRSNELRTRGAREIAAMATGLWEGSWDKILQCPRRHKEVGRAIPNPGYAPAPPSIGALQRTPLPKERRCTPIDVVSFSEGSKNLTDPSIAIVPITELRSSPRKSGANPSSMQGSNATGSASRKPPRSLPTTKNHSPANKLHRSLGRAQPMAAVEEESDIDSDELTTARHVRAATRLASGRLASGGGVHQAVVPTASASPEIIVPRRGDVVQAVFAFLGTCDAFWFVLEQTVRGICLCTILEPYFELLGGDSEDVPHYVTAQHGRPVLHAVGTILFAQAVVGYASGRVRDYARRR
ncbi:hypothetical protein A1O7_00934 [Cladophialophora yegresii CBS 114405]|uniref:Uncharacterized protein n=1 Tax=Cladophialophora yegresii CBS 114405 TaxID=1182544 RepID=W9W8Z9_9EURO|nr:uncharacterized protein A1O7_00934 [Cladophialophora yegresii CBS 114405]EXJ64597.1 hypothetical protein A1O7_00934 [Cladophialophora yegresii CBS 114405]